MKVFSFTYVYLLIVLIIAVQFTTVNGIPNKKLHKSSKHKVSRHLTIDILVVDINYTTYNLKM